MPFTFDYLKAIHSHLFGDIYPSAGMIRTSQSHKHREYCQPEYIQSAAGKLFDGLRQSHYLMGIRDTDDFVPAGSDRYGRDLREAIHPKRPDWILAEAGLEKPYFQVFSGKYGFLSGLSVMDLLFNEGPDSILWLKNIRI